MGVWCEGLGACHANPMPLSLSKTEKVIGKSASGEENEGALGSVTRLTLGRVITVTSQRVTRAGQEKRMCCVRHRAAGQM